MSSQGSGGAFEISTRMTALLGWGATTVGKTPRVTSEGPSAPSIQSRVSDGTCERIPFSTALPACAQQPTPACPSLPSSPPFAAAACPKPLTCLTDFFYSIERFPVGRTLATTGCGTRRWRPTSRTRPWRPSCARAIPRRAADPLDVCVWDIEPTCRSFLPSLPGLQAFQNILKRSLEAAGRGLWDADADTLERLRDLYQEMDSEIEGVAAAGR